jgi:oxalyl-CoA decarboxylase
MERAMSAVLSPTPAAKQDSAATIDGFHLVIDALKLNGIDTIFGLPGIPITDLTRKMQAQGMRVISFRPLLPAS